MTLTKNNNNKKTNGNKKGNNGKNNKEKKKLLPIIIVVSVIAIIFFSVRLYNNKKEAAKIEEMEYTDFLKELKEGNIDTIYYNTNKEYMTFTLLNDETRKMTKEERAEYEYDYKDMRKCLYPAYDTFRKEVLETDTNMVLLKSTIWRELISTIISLALPIIWLWLIFRMFKGTIKGTEKKDVLQTSDVKFTDVIGHEEILDDVKFITELIKDPTKGDKIGAKVPKGILLSGEPGCGKTLIAKAIAGEAGVPFLYQNASAFVEMFVGLGAKRVRDLFKIAKENAPCIIFIDEIDAVGAKRDSAKNNSETEQTVNALLQEMDGFTGREGVFVIAATNRADKLDKALVRAGRFDRQIVVNPPRDWKVRQELFSHYLKKFKVGDDIDVENLSKQVSGFTGADIATVCNEASIIAVMQNKEYIDRACIEEAIDKKVFKGNRAKRDSYVKDKEIVAYHESGHAVMSYLLNEPIARASILATVSGVGGAVFNEDKTDTVFQTDEDFRNRIMICYGGRASEEIKYDGVVTTGASNDITQATNLMLNYIEKMGFDKNFGLLDLEVLSQTHLLSDKEITKKLTSMSNELYDKTLKTLTEHYNLVEKLAQKLLEVETMSGSEIEELFSDDYDVKIN